MTYPVDPRRLKEHRVSVCIHSMFRERRGAAFNFVLFRLISFCIVLPACVITCSGLLLICCFSSQGDLHCIYLARITYTSDCLNFNWCTQHCTLPKSPTSVLYDLDQQYNNPYLANTSLVSSWYFYLSVCHWWSEIVRLQTIQFEHKWNSILLTIAK